MGLTREEARNLVMNEIKSTRHFSAEDLQELDFKIHDVYEEYSDRSPDKSPEEIVGMMIYGFYIRHEPRELQPGLLKEFMSSNLGKLYVEMIRERREIQSAGGRHKL